MGLERQNAGQNGDDILYGFLHMVQPQTGPRINMDTVLLAGFARPQAGERVIELGCAHGGITLILARRFPETSFEGLDIQPELIEMARENACRNGLTENTAFRAGDLREIRRLKTLDTASVPARQSTVRHGRVKPAPLRTCALRAIFC